MITAAFALCDGGKSKSKSKGVRARSGVRAVSAGADAMAGTTPNTHGELLGPLVVNENENDFESKAGSGKRERKRVLRE